LQERIVELDSLKGLAIIGVVIAHSSFRERLGDNVMGFVEQMQLIFGWCVIAFFFSSGYLAKAIDVDTSTSFGQFVIHRVKRLLVPCLVFSVSYKLFFVMLSQTGYFTWNVQVPRSLSEIALFVFEPVGPQFYFLPYLFGISVVINLLLFRCSFGVLQFLGVLLLLGSYFFLDVPLSGYGPGVELLPIYVAAYLVGLLSSRDAFTGRIGYYLAWISSVLVLCVFRNTFIFIYLLIPPALLFLMKKNVVLNQPFQFLRLGEYSPGIYVWHAPLLMPFISIVFGSVSANGYVRFMGTLLVTIPFCYLLQHLTYRFSFLKIWRF